MGEGVICHGFGGGIAEMNDDRVDFWLCERVGELKSCEVKVLQRHEPEI
jgi:hypothetical protein